MLLVCMKCVNCSILFLILSMLSCSMSMLCVLVFCSIVGRGVQGVVWRRGRWWLGWSRGLMSPHWLRVWCVSGWRGWLSGRGWSLVSPWEVLECVEGLGVVELVKKK